jgi:predicted secreted protein
MSTPAHPIVVKVGTDGAVFNEMDGIKSVKFGPSRTMLETTDFKDASGAKTRMAGLKDGVIELSGDLEEADADGQNVVRTAWENGTDCHVEIDFIPGAAAGSKGYKVKGIVESYEIAGEVDDIVTFSATIQFNGAPVAV